MLVLIGLIISLISAFIIHKVKQYIFLQYGLQL